MSQPCISALWLGSGFGWVGVLSHTTGFNTSSYGARVRVEVRLSMTQTYRRVAAQSLPGEACGSMWRWPCVATACSPPAGLVPAYLRRLDQLPPPPHLDKHEVDLQPAGHTHTLFPLYFPLLHLSVPSPPLLPSWQLLFLPPWLFLFTLRTSVSKTNKKNIDFHLM